MGCTVSPVLFVLAMEVIVRSSEDSGQGVEVAPGQILPPIRSFMDDLTLLNSQPQITESPIKSLGYTKELKDTNRAKESSSKWTKAWHRSREVVFLGSASFGVCSLVSSQGWCGLWPSTKWPSPMLRQWSERSVARVESGLEFLSA